MTIVRSPHFRVFLFFIILKFSLSQKLHIGLYQLFYSHPSCDEKYLVRVDNATSITQQCTTLLKKGEDSSVTGESRTYSCLDATKQIREKIWDNENCEGLHDRNFESGMSNCGLSNEGLYRVDLCAYNDSQWNEKEYLVTSYYYGYQCGDNKRLRSYSFYMLDKCVQLNTPDHGSLSRSFNVHERSTYDVWYKDDSCKVADLAGKTELNYCYGYKNSKGQNLMWITDIFPPIKDPVISGIEYAIIFSILGLIMFLICIIISIVVIVFVLIIMRKGRKVKSRKDHDKFHVSTASNSSVIDEDLKNEVEISEKLLAKLKINESLFKVDMSKVKLLHRIGSGGGSASEIFKGSWYQKDVAVKLFRTSLFGDQHDFDEFEKEITIISGISHPNIIRFYGCALNPPKVSIVMFVSGSLIFHPFSLFHIIYIREFCSKGDLQTYFLKEKKENGSIDFKVKLKICIETCYALRYLHEKNIIHRDVKPQNILLSDNFTAKLIDFGLSRIITSSFSKKTKRIGTKYYLAPEVCLGSQYDTTADVFSLGIVFYAIFSENVDNPFKNVKSDVSIEIAVAQDENLRPSFNPDSCNGIHINDDLQTLISHMWKATPNDRPHLTHVISKLKEQN